MSPDARPTAPVVVVVGLGPAGEDLTPSDTVAALVTAERAYLRTSRHPSAAFVTAAVRSADGGAHTDVESFDEVYESAATFDDVYRAIVERLVAAAAEIGPNGGHVAYAVPGSPLVAERTVELLRADDRVDVDIRPALSFLDLAWACLGIDPLQASVRLVDGADFAVSAAGERGPLLVAQCHDRATLSEIKLAVETPPSAPVVVLRHLGLEDESVTTVEWADLDRTVDADHLTTLWIPELAAPVGRELVALDELVRTLRARCPWDREQTHGSLARHLLEEAYETLDAIEAVAGAEQAGDDVPEAAIAHLQEELGDLLVQVSFHATLAAESGWFTMADVAEGVHDKLVGRHPHVFGEVIAETPDAVAANWEAIKKAEKGRTSVTEGIPVALRALALAAKLQRKAESVGMAQPTLDEERSRIRELAEAPEGAGSDGGSGEVLAADGDAERAVGELLMRVAGLARRLGVDPESALRGAAGRFRNVIEARE